MSFANILRARTAGLIRARFHFYVVPVTAAKSLGSVEACGCLVTCHGREAASNEAWDEWLESVTLYVKATTKPRLVIITGGGAPSPEQRKKFDRTVESHMAQMKIAIVSDSTFARGVVKAIRLFYPFYQSFALKELDDALRFLDVRPTDFVEVTRSAERLRASLPG
jgi:hypothetical protein